MTWTQRTEMAVPDSRWQFMNVITEYDRKVFLMEYAIARAGKAESLSPASVGREAVIVLEFIEEYCAGRSRDT